MAPTIPPDGLIRCPDGIKRCWWCAGDELYQHYHDNEWSHPCVDDRYIYEKICLEGFQAGLSWITVLRKRENFRKAFHNFDAEKVARFNEKSIERLLQNEGIIRHRKKIESAINNAKRALELKEEFGSLAHFLWQFEPKKARYRKVTIDMLPELVTSPESKALSKEFKRRGWTFVGPTTMYAMMQSLGLVNDHLVGCGRRAAAERQQRQFLRPKSQK